MNSLVDKIKEKEQGRNKEFSVLEAGTRRNH